MTTTTNCIDCGRKLTSSNRDRSNRDMCTKCYEYAGDENWHDDEAHDETGPVEGCAVCEGRTVEAPKTGHTNGVAKSHTSHAGHDHPSTKAARAACRKAAKA